MDARAQTGTRYSVTITNRPQGSVLRIMVSPMAFIPYADESTLAPNDRVPDPDNIIQIHRVHPAVMRQHHALYLELMHRPGPLTRRRREMLAVRVSALNGCHY